MQIEGLELAVRRSELAWRPTRHAGIAWSPLHLGGEGSGSERDSVVLIRMDPGCGYPAHEHLDCEDVFLLQGGYRDEYGEHRAGGYVRYASGSRHAPIALGRKDLPPGPDNPACILFAVARGGVRVLDDARASER
ncbi:MAG: cupin domain-containing protein [Planctomycetes bacterium]|nr:cupin domain-containing protein [Planctomycetota bacterium]